MGRIIFKNLVRPILRSILTALAAVVFMLLFMLVAMLIGMVFKFFTGGLEMDSGWAAPNVYWVFFGVASGIVINGLFAFRGERVAQKDDDNFKGNLFPKTKLLWLIFAVPFTVGLLLLAACILFSVFATMPEMQEKLMQFTQTETPAAMLSDVAVVNVILGAFFTTHIMFYFTIVISYINYASCKNCKRAFSLRPYNESGAVTSESTQYKTKTERRQVGSIKGGGEEIGVYADVQTTKARKIRTTSKTLYCQCKQCGEYAEKYRSDWEIVS